MTDEEGPLYLASRLLSAVTREIEGNEAAVSDPQSSLEVASKALEYIDGLQKIRAKVLVLADGALDQDDKVVNAQLVEIMSQLLDQVVARHNLSR